MLDKLSKKIVQHMNTAESPSDTYYDFMDDLDEIAENTHSDSESVRAAVRYLEEQGYIKYSYTQNGIAFQFYQMAAQSPWIHPWGYKPPLGHFH